MLLTNQRIEKLAAFHADAAARMMLSVPLGIISVSKNRSLTTPESTNASQDDPMWSQVAHAEQESGPVDGPEVSATVTLACNRGDYSNLKFLIRLYTDPALTLEHGYPSELRPLSEYISHQAFPDLIRQFLFDQTYPDAPEPSFLTDPSNCPAVDNKLHVAVYHSATSVYWAPSDRCGVGGMS